MQFIRQRFSLYKEDFSHMDDRNKYLPLNILILRARRSLVVLFSRERQRLC